VPDCVIQDATLAWPYFSPSISGVSNQIQIFGFDHGMKLDEGHTGLTALPALHFA